MGHAVGINIYRIVQEALHNVFKHADAGNVAVLLERVDGAMKLMIEDDGCGFAVARAGENGTGMGLLSMRERASLIAGDVEIESSPGNGTTLYVRVPLPGSK